MCSRGSRPLSHLPAATGFMRLGSRRSCFLASPSGGISGGRSMWIGRHFDSFGFSQCRPSSTFALLSSLERPSPWFRIESTSSQLGERTSQSASQSPSIRVLALGFWEMRLGSPSCRASTLACWLWGQVVLLACRSPTRPFIVRWLEFFSCWHQSCCYFRRYPPPNKTLQLTVPGIWPSVQRPN